MQPAHKYLSNLTPLRGFAALWVAVYHFQGVAVSFVSVGATHLIDKGKTLQKIHQ
jgi:peptidoglycan/LPS O-acetylase OafA/YrhL